MGSLHLEGCTVPSCMKSFTLLDARNTWSSCAASLPAAIRDESEDVALSFNILPELPEVSIERAGMRAL
jgi:hypothetical protein